MLPIKTCQLKSGKLLTIRSVMVEDAEELIDYLAKVAGESDNLSFGEGDFNPDIDRQRKFIEDMISVDNQIMIVGEVDGRIAGSLSYRGGARPRVAHTGEMGITVLKEFWGLGIGRNLIQYLIDWARDSHKIRKINLRARSDNFKAIELYKKMGFEQEGIWRRDFLIAGEFYDSICMGLLID